MYLRIDLYYSAFFNSFSNKNIFRTPRNPSCCNILVSFLSKRHWKLILMLLLFLHTFCSKLFTICHFVTIAYTWLIWKQTIFRTWYTLFLIPFKSKSDSSVVESSPHKPWIGGSNPGGNYTSFSVSRRLNPCLLKTVHFVPLKQWRLSQWTRF